ncbi:MAG TPA: hypothetical protein VIP98_00515 [Microlunatus sp.]
MQRHTTIGRRVAGIAAAAAVVAGSLTSMTAPAQAYSPDPTVNKYHRNTGDCPCSGGELADPFDGTYFEKDPGGTALKMELTDSSGWFVGKVEFHPYDEKLWVYDTRNDGDGIFVTLSYYDDNGRNHTLGVFDTPSTQATVDKRVYDLSLPEGRLVTIRVWDNAALTDWIETGQGRA